MKKKRFKNFLLITVLMAATGVAMAYSSNKTNFFFQNRSIVSSQQQTLKNGIVSVSGHLIQDKVLQGSDGTLGLSLTLQAEEIATSNSGEARNVDMVIVLDRSGSMKGRKINDARQAVLKLLSNLTSKDRFGLVTYSDGVHIASGLLNVTRANRQRME